MGMRLPRKPKPPVPPVPPERDVQRACLDYLTFIGAAWVRVNGGMLPTARGAMVKFNHASSGTCSDVVACLGGRFIGIEIKRKGGKATEGQRFFLDAVTAAGGLGIVVSSVEALAAALKAEGYDTKGVN